MKHSNKKTDHTGFHSLNFWIGMAAMVTLVFAINFISFGSLTQKMILTAATFVLLVVAITSVQRLLIAVEATLLIGNFLAFLDLGGYLTLAILLAGAGILLWKIGREPGPRLEWTWLLGTVAFLLLAIGYALNNGTMPLIAGFALGFGSLLFAAYSLAMVLLYKVRIQLVWLLLNVFFSITPLIVFFSVV